MKLPGHRAGLPGHAVASGLRAKENSFILCSFLPAGRQGPRLSRFGGTGHVPVTKFETSTNVQNLNHLNKQTGFEFCYFNSGFVSRFDIPISNFPSVCPNPPNPFSTFGGNEEGRKDSDFFHLDHRVHPSLSFPDWVPEDRYDGIGMNARPLFSPPEEVGLRILASKRFPLRGSAVAPAPQTV